MSNREPIDIYPHPSGFGTVRVYEHMGLGRRPPTDDRHLQKFSLSARPLSIPEIVETVLPLPRYVDVYNQGVEGACTGFAASWLMSIINRRRYVPQWLYETAKEIDEWEGVDYDGTSVRAVMDVLRTRGHIRYRKGNRMYPPDLNEGIVENRWATTVDEIRACLSIGVPVVLGCNWYRDFDHPIHVNGGRMESWIGVRDVSLPDEHGDWKQAVEPRDDLGPIRGGHAVCIYGASDRREAVKIVNSWGKAYPPVWMHFHTLQRLLDEQGEAAVVTDRLMGG